MKRLCITLVGLMFLATASVAKGRKTYDRGIKTSTFMPKGSKVGGISFNYFKIDADDYDFLILDGIDAKGYTFSVSPHFAYTFKDDIAIGVKGSFRRSYANIQGMDVSLGDDLSFEMDHWRTMSNSFRGAVFLRTYMSLFGSKVVGFYNDVELSYTYGRTKTLNHTGNDLDGSFQVNHGIRIGARPGLAVFVRNNMAVDVNLDVAGLSFNWKEQTRNQVEKGTYFKSSANFQLNILSVGIGITTYF